VIYLDVEDLLYIAERAVGGVTVRDLGLLEAAAGRPQAAVFGAEVYRSLHSKAAALLHSIVRNRALVAGNKRLGLAAVIAFYGVNGRRLTMTNNKAYDLVIAVACGELDDVQAIAGRLEAASEESR
jgi:death on curing protein